jgi:hypothetical protein
MKSFQAACKIEKYPLNYSWIYPKIFDDAPSAEENRLILISDGTLTTPAE